MKKLLLALLFLQIGFIKSMDGFDEQALRDLGFSEGQIAQQYQDWQAHMLIQQQIIEKAEQRKQQRQKVDSRSSDDDPELTQAIAESLEQQTSPSQASIDSGDDEFGEFQSGGVVQGQNPSQKTTFNQFFFDLSNQQPLRQQIGLSQQFLVKPAVASKPTRLPKKVTPKPSPKNSPKTSQKSSSQTVHKHFLDPQIEDVQNKIQNTMVVLQEYRKKLTGEMETEMSQEDILAFIGIFEEQLINQEQELQDLQKQKMRTPSTKQAQTDYLRSLIAEVRDNQGKEKDDTGSAAAACAAPVNNQYASDAMTDEQLAQFLQDQLKATKNVEFENKNVGDRVPADGIYAGTLFQQMVIPQQGAQCGREAMINMHNIVAQFLGKGRLYKPGGFEKACEWLEVEDFENKWKTEYGKLAETTIPFIMIDSNSNVMGTTEQIGQDFVEYAQSILNKPGKQALVTFINTSGQEQALALNIQRKKGDSGVTIRAHWFAMAILKDTNNKLTYVVVDSLGYPSNNDRRDDQTVTTIIALLESVINK